MSKEGGRIAMGAQRQTSFSAVPNTKAVAPMSIDALQDHVQAGIRAEKSQIDKKSHPVEVSIELLNSMRKIFAEKKMHSSEFEDITRNWKYKELEALARRKLRNLDMSVYSWNNEEKLSFWLNTYHLVLIFANANAGKLVLKDWPLFWTTKYNIGGNHYSLLHIEHAILRAQMSIPEMSFVMNMSVPKFKETNKKYKYIVETKEPLLNFVISQSTASSCPISIYYPSSVKTQILENAKSFLSQHFTFDFDNKIVTYPEIIDFYQKDFGPNKKAALLNVISLTKPKEEYERYTSLVQALDTTIKVSKFKWKFFLEFTKEWLNRPTQSRGTGFTIGKSKSVENLQSSQEKTVRFEGSEPENNEGNTEGALVAATEEQQETPPAKKRNITKEGYLTKQGKRIKNWKRRWFVLKGLTLFYYKRKTDKTPAGKIPLRNAQVNVEDETKINKMNCFYVEASKEFEERKLFVFADNSETMYEWLDAIVEAQDNNEEEPEESKKERRKMYVPRDPFTAIKDLRYMRLPGRKLLDSTFLASLTEEEEVLRIPGITCYRVVKRRKEPVVQNGVLTICRTNEPTICHFNVFHAEYKDEENPEKLNENQQNSNSEEQQEQQKEQEQEETIHEQLEGVKDAVGPNEPEKPTEQSVQQSATETFKEKETVEVKKETIEIKEKETFEVNEKEPNGNKVIPIKITSTVSSTSDVTTEDTIQSNTPLPLSSENPTEESGNPEANAGDDGNTEEAKIVLEDDEENEEENNDPNKDEVLIIKEKKRVVEAMARRLSVRYQRLSQTHPGVETNEQQTTEEETIFRRPRSTTRVYANIIHFKIPDNLIPVPLPTGEADKNEPFPVFASESLLRRRKRSLGNLKYDIEIEELPVSPQAEEPIPESPKKRRVTFEENVTEIPPPVEKIQTVNQAEKPMPVSEEDDEISEGLYDPQPAAIKKRTVPRAEPKPKSLDETDATFIPVVEARPKDEPKPLALDTEVDFDYQNEEESPIILKEKAFGWFSNLQEKPSLRPYRFYYLFTTDFNKDFLMVELPRDVSLELMDKFELILTYYTSFHRMWGIRYGEETNTGLSVVGAINMGFWVASTGVETSGTLFSRGVIKGAEYIAKGTRVISDLCIRHTDAYDGPSMTDEQRAELQSLNVNSVSTGLEAISTVAVKTSGYMYTEFKDRLKEGGRYISQAAVEGSKVATMPIRATEWYKQRQEAHRKYMDEQERKGIRRDQNPGAAAFEIVRAGIAAYKSVKDGVEQAVVITGTGFRDATTDIVRHKFGDYKGELTKHNLNVVGNAVISMYNTYKVMNLFQYTWVRAALYTTGGIITYDVDKKRNLTGPAWKEGWLAWKQQVYHGAGWISYWVVLRTYAIALYLNPEDAENDPKNPEKYFKLTNVRKTTLEDVEVTSRPFSFSMRTMKQIDFFSVTCGELDGWEDVKPEDMAGEAAAWVNALQNVSEFQRLPRVQRLEGY